MAIRILGGQFRSRTLKTPPGRDTRPTRSMVREAVFNMLQGRVEGALVLDLFAGSGAMGFEALSRGAATAVLCDKSRQSVETIRDNAASLGCEGLVSVLEMDWQAALPRLSRQNTRFDLIFLDPPYKMGIEQVLAALSQGGFLKDEGLLVLEQATQFEPADDVGFMVYKARRYGESWVHLMRNRGEAS